MKSNNGLIKESQIIGNKSKHAKSMININHIRKTIDAFPTLTHNANNSERNTHNVSRPTSTKTNLKTNKSQGKLVLGKNNKPIFLMTKQQRKNPLAKRTTINEEVLKKKGIFQLTSMGVITKNMNCEDLLNNRYEVIIEKEVKNIDDVFITDPTILINTYYESNKIKENQEIHHQIRLKEDLQSKQYSSPEPREQNTPSTAKGGKRTSKPKKLKNYKPELLLAEFIKEDQVHLNMLCFQIEKNESYLQYLKKVRNNGMEVQFKLFLKQMSIFAEKYQIKKLTFTPNLNETVKTTNKMLLNCIRNHKIYGMDLRVKGSPLQIMSSLMKMKKCKISYLKMKAALVKIEKFKNIYKIKQFYNKTMERRWQYINFKLGSFAENQRRLVEENRDYPLKPSVEIHLLTTSYPYPQLSSFYKLSFRQKMQLTRLFSNQPDYLILLVDNSTYNIESWLDLIEKTDSNWKKPKIQIIKCCLNQHYQVEESAHVYFGLNLENIQLIKNICHRKIKALIPYQISSYLPKICQTIGVQMFAGNFTKESIKILFEEDQNSNQNSKELSKNQTNNHSEKPQDEFLEKINQQRSMDGKKFKKISDEKTQNKSNIQKISRIRLGNKVYESKLCSKLFFIEEKVSTPLSYIHDSSAVKVSALIKEENVNMFTEISKIILLNKQYNNWVLKLPNSMFSRGIAFLETESLKILKEKKRKLVIKESDINEVASIMQNILTHKIIIPHSNLLTGEEFISEFIANHGYMEAFIDNTLSLCIFGRIELNGSFTFLGTYQKYYTEQHICCAASYPAKEITTNIIQTVAKMSTNLYHSKNFFGYVTFQLLYQPKNNSFFFIDFVPHLQQFSSLFFYYKRVLNMNQLDFQKQTNKLKKQIFYCPFIDNNGNKCENLKEFRQLCKEYRIKFQKDIVEGQQFFFLNEEKPDMLSLVCFGDEFVSVLKSCLEGLTFLVDIGGEFNKFDKETKNRKSDGLYIMDIIWKLRQLKKECQK